MDGAARKAERDRRGVPSWYNDDDYADVNGAAARARRGIPPWFDGDEQDYLGMGAAERLEERNRRGVPDWYNDDDYADVNGAGAAARERVRRGVPPWFDGDEQEYLLMNSAERQEARNRRGIPDWYNDDEYMGFDGHGGGPVSRSMSYENALDTVGTGGLMPPRGTSTRMDTRTGLKIEVDDNKNATLRFVSVRRSNPLLLAMEAMERDELANGPDSDDEDTLYGIDRVGAVNIMSGPGRADRRVPQTRPTKRGGHDQDLIDQLHAYNVPEHPTLRGPRIMRKPTEWGMIPPSVADELPYGDPNVKTLRKHQDGPDFGETGDLVGSNVQTLRTQRG